MNTSPVLDQTPHCTGSPSHRGGRSCVRGHRSSSPCPASAITTTVVTSQMRTPPHLEHCSYSFRCTSRSRAKARPGAGNSPHDRQTFRRMPQAHSSTSCTDSWSRSTMSTAFAARSMFSIVEPARPVFNRTNTPGQLPLQQPCKCSPGRHRIRSTPLGNVHHQYVGRRCISWEKIGPPSSICARRVPAAASLGHLATRSLNHPIQSTSSPPAASPAR